MSSVFTEHIRNFGSHSAADPNVLSELEKVLKQRMRRRNLLSARPSRLGYIHSSWNEVGAFEDIVSDCYIFSILVRLRGLQNQLRVRDNVDGIIKTNIDNFLSERQRRLDPIGYAVFGNVDGAAFQAQDAGKLTIEGLERGRLNNHSILRLDQSQLNAAPVEPERLSQALEQAPDWNEMLPKFTETTVEGQEWVASYLVNLKDAGVPAIRCGDLIAVIAERARYEWRRRHALASNELAFEGDGDLGTLVRMILPDMGLDDQDHWENLKQHVAREIQALDRQQRVLDKLSRVWARLVQAVDGGGLISQAELVIDLDIPRATMAELFDLLRGILEQVRQKNNPEAGR